jgi:hypothetical protein
LEFQALSSEEIWEAFLDFFHTFPIICESSFVSVSGTNVSGQMMTIFSSDFRRDLEQVQVAWRIAESQNGLSSSPDIIPLFSVRNARIIAAFWFHLNFHCLEVNNWTISLLLNQSQGAIDPVNLFLCNYYSFNSKFFLQPFPTNYDADKIDKEAWLKSKYLSYAIDYKESMEKLLQASHERETDLFIIDPDLSDVSHVRYVMDYLTGVVIVNSNDFQTTEECEKRCSQIINSFKHQIMYTVGMPAHTDSVRRLVHLIKFHGLIYRFR